VLLLPDALLQSIVELAAQAGRAPDAYSHAEHTAAAGPPVFGADLAAIVSMVG
jgi:hypothetical protein